MTTQRTPKKKLKPVPVTLVMFMAITASTLVIQNSFAAKEPSNPLHQEHSSKNQISEQRIPKNHSLKTIVEGKQSQLPQSPTLIQFWAPWCHSCAGIIWDLDPILDQFPLINFASINIDNNDENARTYIQKHTLYSKYQHAFYTEASSNLLTELNVSAVPLILLVNKEGKVVFRYASHLNSESKSQLINAMQQVEAR
jgi:thiol-disulfide isomerase/thioredoxin|tara:strand:- start:671 stop:1261 length:591 start_codon:yes stop_codon:yes gene_type:complete